MTRKLFYFNAVVCTICFSFGSWLHTDAQNFIPEFEHINLEHGLPHSTVSSIVNDSYGYIWIGTEGGLARYDSRSFKIYNSEAPEGNLLSNHVLMIHEDEDSVVWIGTRHSLELYLRDTDSFRHFDFFPDANQNESQMVTDFIKSSDNNYFICTDGGGLYRLHLPEGINGPADLKQPILPAECSRFSSVCKEGENILWFGTYTQGLYKYDIELDHWENISIIPGNEIEIRSIVDDDPEYLFIGTYNRGLCRFDKNTRESTFFQHQENNQSSIGSNRVWVLHREASGNIWVGTDGGGLNYFNIETEEFSRYQYRGFDSKSISNNSVYAVTIDREGNLWTGNYRGGVNLSKGQPGFYFLGSNPGYPNSLDNKLVSAILIDSKGLLWIGTDGRGVNIYDKNWKRVEDKILPASLLNKIRMLPVLSVFEDSKQNIWIGTYLEGFFRFNPGTGKFQQFKAGNPKYPQLRNNDVRCFYEDKDGKIWAGTNGGGIYIYDPLKDDIQSIVRDMDSENSLSLDWIRDIHADSYGFIWIATAFGLNSYDPAKKQFVNYYRDREDSLSIAENMVYSIHEDKNKVLWFGTNDGLSKFDRITNTFKNYFVEDGLPSSTIVGIIEDEESRLWLPTNFGLSMFDPAAEKFTNYYRSEGLNSYSFIENASFRDISGEIYLGTIEGLVYFHPDSVGKSDIDLPVRITNLLLFNKPVQIGEELNGRVILTKDISRTKDISLLYRQNVVSLEYTALYFKDPSLVKYRYKLEGFDEDWNYDLKGNQIVTYTNLKPDEYNFIVQVLDNKTRDKVINTTQLRINVIPPFYMRSWFRILIVLSLIFLGYSWYLNRLTSWRKQQEELKRKMLEDQLRNEKEQMQLRSEKLRAEFEKQEAQVTLKNSQLISFALQLTHKNDIMRKIKNRLNQYYKSIKNEQVKEGIIELNETIDQEFKLQKDWERFESHFNEVHRDFFTKLKGQYPDLGVTYLRLSAYLKLELSSKEIASLMNISTRGVEKARSRLRKKFDLGRNESLSSFLARV